MKTLKNVITSYHFWIWIVYIAFALFTYYYPKVHIYENVVDKIYAPIEWWFIFIMFSSIWLFVYTLLILNE